MSKPEVDPDYDNESLCLDEVRRFDHDRFLTLAFASGTRQAPLAALYAFNAEIARIPTLVSDPMLGQIRLQWWRETIAELDKGEVRGHVAARALADARESAAISSRELLRLIDARERDLDEAPFSNLPDLERHAVATSSVVLSMAVEIMGAETTDYSISIRHGGIAYALTGLLRAIPAHASQGRLMLPADLLNHYSVDPHDILAGKMVPGLHSVMLDIIRSARKHLATARNAASVPRKLLPAFLPLSLCDHYLKLMSAPGFNPFTSSSDVPTYRKGLRLLGRNIAGRF